MERLIPLAQAGGKYLTWQIDNPAFEQSNRRENFSGRLIKKTSLENFTEEMLNAKKKYNRKAQIDSVAGIFFDKEKKKHRFFKQLCDVSETRKRPFSIIYICRIICIMYSYCFVDNGLISKRKILKQAPKTAFRTRTKLFLSAKLNLFCFPDGHPYFQTFSAR